MLTKDYRHIAAHIRGRVFLDGPSTVFWGFRHGEVK